MRKAVLSVVFCLLTLVPPAGAEAPGPYLDLDFELPECSTFWPTQGFTSFPYEHQVDATRAQSGRQSLRVGHLSPLPFSPVLGPSVFKFLDPAEVAGRRVRFSGYIQTEGITSGSAGIYLFATGPQGGVLQRLPQSAAGTQPWTLYQVEADVPPGVTTAYVAMERTGNGTAWFDNLAVEIDGEPLKQGPPSSLSGPPPGHATWLSQRVAALDAVTPGNGFADLQALKPVIGDARIVALGEGTHGTREFFQMKHRLFEFLVEEMGFTHFAMEAALPESQKINEYVLTGVGDPLQLLRGQRSWPWITQEVLDLIVWMRQYNAAGKGPVQFAGFDMLLGRTAAENLTAFLAQAEPDYLPQAQSVFARVSQVERTGRATAADLAAAQGLYDHLVARRQDYLAAGFAEDQVDRRIQDARVLVQFCDARSAGGPAARARAMAENVGWLLDRAPAGTKMVLWAHNAHVKKAGQNMGGLLAQRYGDEMYTVGFALNHGFFNSQGVTGRHAFEAVPAPPSSVEGLLAATGIPQFFVDLQGLGDQGPARWFHETKLMRSLGTPVVRCGFFDSVPAAEYDGLIWIERSTPSTLLPL